MSGAPESLEPERLAGLALVPTVATGLYYALPPPLQTHWIVLFLPQALGYLGLVIWLRHNRDPLKRLGLNPFQLGEGLRWGVPTGLALGLFNVGVILWGIPWLGADITFLRDTPHARLPTVVMLPWAILFIAVGVELNFRGFLLGRLFHFCQASKLCRAIRVGTGLRADSALAVGVTSLAFSFDPFMVVTFKHLHWIAIWDSLVWGTIWLRLRNLYATIVAHAVEVMVMYAVLRIVLIA